MSPALEITVAFATVLSNLVMGMAVGGSLIGIVVLVMEGRSIWKQYKEESER